MLCQIKVIGYFANEMRAVICKLNCGSIELRKLKKSKNAIHSYRNAFLFILFPKTELHYTFIAFYYCLKLNICQRAIGDT